MLESHGRYFVLSFPPLSSVPFYDWELCEEVEQARGLAQTEPMFS